MTLNNHLFSLCQKFQHGVEISTLKLNHNLTDENFEKKRTYPVPHILLDECYAAILPT